MRLPWRPLRPTLDQHLGHCIPSEATDGQDGQMAVRESLLANVVAESSAETVWVIFPWPTAPHSQRDACDVQSSIFGNAYA